MPEHANGKRVARNSPNILNRARARRPGIDLPEKAASTSGSGEMNTYSTAAITATETTRFIPVDMGTILYGLVRLKKIRWLTLNNCRYLIDSEEIKISVPHSFLQCLTQQTHSDDLFLSGKAIGIAPQWPLFFVRACFSLSRLRGCISCMPARGSWCVDRSRQPPTSFHRPNSPFVSFVLIRGHFFSSSPFLITGSATISKKRPPNSHFPFASFALIRGQFLLFFVTPYY